jgi:hypothetical protein
MALVGGRAPTKIVIAGGYDDPACARTRVARAALTEALVRSTVDTLKRGVAASKPQVLAMGSHGAERAIAKLRLTLPPPRHPLWRSSLTYAFSLWPIGLLVLAGGCGVGTIIYGQRRIILSAVT